MVVAHRPGPRPHSSRSQIYARRRATTAEERKSQIRPTTNRSTHEQSRIQTKAGQQQHHLEEMKMRRPWTPTQISWTPPSALKRSTVGKRRGGEGLFRRNVDAFASSTSPRRARRGGPNSQQTLASPSCTNDGQNLELGNLLPTPYTTTWRFPGPSPSTMPRRPSERKRAGEIDAGIVVRPLFASGNCSKGKRGERGGKADEGEKGRCGSKLLHCRSRTPKL
jgi:hypothetical protein